MAQRLLLRTVIRATLRVRIQGIHHLDGLQGPFVLVANHSSHLDAPLLLTQLPWATTRTLATAAAADYFYRKRWRRTLTSIFFNSYPVERGSNRGEDAGWSLALLRRQVPLLIFPEGSRSRTGRMGAFKPGAATLARTCRVPLVPAALAGSSQAMPVGTFWPKRGRPQVRMVVGEPLVPRPREPVQELNARLIGQIQALLEQANKSDETGGPESDDPQENVS